MTQPAFLKKPLEEMTAKEWESLCDGCGLCCQVRLEDEESGEITLSNSACNYLCLDSHQCKDYENRLANVGGCAKITPQNIKQLDWLPYSCGYRLAAFGNDLPEWHHLICGDKNAVHERGSSMMGALISEDEAEESGE